MINGDKMKFKKLLIILFIIIGVFIISCKKDYSSLLDEAYSLIELPAETKDNLDFPTSIEVSGSLINAKFTTTSPNLTPSGVVTRSDEDEVVLVSVELSYANQSKNYVIGEIIIKKIEKEKCYEESPFDFDVFAVFCVCFICGRYVYRRETLL